MATNDNQPPFKFRSIADIIDALQFWKQRYNNLYNANQHLNIQYKALNEKYQQLASCHSCIREDPEDDETQHPAKRQKILSQDEISSDPLKKLPEPVANKIMKFLTGKELLNAMRVSSSWRDFIKVRGSLMDKVIFKPPTLDNDNNLPLSCQIYCNVDKRHYKHMKGPLNLRKKFCVSFRLIALYAATLETLEVTNSHDEGGYGSDFDDHNASFSALFISCHFQKLRKLTCSISTALEFNKEDCSYPALTHLKLKKDPDRDDRFDATITQAMPNLQVLILDLNYEEEMFYDEEDLSNEENKALSTLTQKHSEIKAISTDVYNTFLLKAYQSSLEKFEIRCATRRDFYELLKDLKCLKSLTIMTKYMYKHDDIFDPYNVKEFKLSAASIEILKIRNIVVNNCDMQKRLRDILLALPNLKELVLFKEIIQPQTLRFIAANMCHLKKLTCKEITDELQRAYQEIQSNPHLYKNTTFEFIAEPNVEFDEIEKEFERA